MRDDAATVREAPQARRRSQVKSIVHRVGRLERELLALELDIAIWDGVHPPLQALTERLKTVESALDGVEARLQALRQRAGD